MIDRTTAVATLLDDWRSPLIVTGLGNATNDVAALTDQADTVFTMDGVMGAAVSVGLGVALARPERRVVVVTGDGELLMNVGALATVAVQRPANLAVLVLDNAAYDLTGGQASHTGSGVDIEAIARGSGFRHTITVTEAAGLPPAAAVIAGEGPALAVVKVASGNSAYPDLDRNGERIRLRFLQGVQRGVSGDERRAS